MGNIASKKGSVIEKTPEKSVASIDDQSPIVDDIIKANRMLDPKTPAIPQTPLTQTIANHLNRISNDDVNQNKAIQTPSYLLRKKILYDLGYTYTIKDDPRSPSLAIPRTPLSLTEKPQVAVNKAVNESDSSSFQFNTTLEDSCKDFNEKLDDITMEEEETETEMVEKVQNDENNEKSIESESNLCEEKTPNCELCSSPKFENHSNDNLKQANIARDDCGTTDSKEENINPHEGMCSTPLMAPGKFNRTGRIPLSVLNRRGVSAEQSIQSPLQLKMNHEPQSVEKYKRDLSFSKLDESRGSARKSKIPVYRK